LHQFGQRFIQAVSLPIEITNFEVQIRQIRPKLNRRLIFLKSFFVLS